MTVSVKSMKDNNLESNIKTQIEQLITIHNNHVTNLEDYLESIPNSYQSFIKEGKTRSGKKRAPVEKLRINLDGDISSFQVKTDVRYSKYVKRIRGTVDDFYRKSDKLFGMKKIIYKFEKFSANIDYRGLPEEEALEKYGRRIIPDLYVSDKKLYEKSTALPKYFYSFVVLHRDEMLKILKKTLSKEGRKSFESIDLGDDHKHDD